jgi:acylphosphatase
MSESVRVHLVISGVVQGVFFRANTEKVARSLHLTGWVRNLTDGRVEVVAEGQHDRIGEFIDWCHRGPPAASVDDVEVVWQEATGEFETFNTSYGR